MCSCDFCTEGLGMSLRYTPLYAMSFKVGSFFPQDLPVQGLRNGKAASGSMQAMLESLDLIQLGSFTLLHMKYPPGN